MKYCATKDCPVSWETDRYIYCQACGQELTPEISCLCGQAAFNPKLQKAMKFCHQCGKEFTPEYLGQCMKAQLGALVQEITAKL